jgi:hypothetical protein
MRYFIWLLSFVLAMLVVNTDMEAQVRKKTTSKKSTKSTKAKEEKVKLMDKINPEIKFGNLGFFNGLSISTKANVGYKLHDRFSAGIGGKLFFDQFSVEGPDPSILDLGGFVYGRGKITNEIYIQAEYAFMKYAADPVGFLPYRNLIEDKKVNYPLIGLGYSSGINKWRFGVELLYIASEAARDYQSAVVEYWFGASYNF